MLLFHSTPGSNSQSITTCGVTIESSRRWPSRIWLHTWKMRRWARFHLAVRYKVDPRQITTFAVDMPRGWVVKFSKGIWTCNRTIPPNRLIGQTFFLLLHDTLNDEPIGFDFDIFSGPGKVPLST